MIMLELQPFQETLNVGMCGPASLKIVLGYYGIDKSEKELAKLCGTMEKLGTNDMGIETASKKLGFNVSIKNNGSFIDLEKWLAKGVPPIVNWFTRGRKDYSDSAVADGHYSIVCRLDKNYIHLQDPEIGGIRKIKKNDFLKVWFDFSGEFINRDNLIIRQIIAIYK